MAIRTQLTALAIAVSLLPVSGCRKANTPQKQLSSTQRHTIGNQLMLLELRIGNIWGNGYTVRVFPDDYLLLEHKNCREAKRNIGDRPDPTVEGICVVRLNQQESNRFEAAMRPYLRYSVPLSSFSMGDPDSRPDGKPCRSNVTDQDLVSLIWTTTEGTRIAPFYTGCDQQEFAKFYNELLHIADSLPIQQIIGKH